MHKTMYFTSAVNLAWLQSSKRETQWFKYFKLVASYFSKYQMCNLEQFLQIQSQLLPYMHSIHRYIVAITAVCNMLVMYHVKFTSTHQFYRNIIS